MNLKWCIALLAMSFVLSACSAADPRNVEEAATHTIESAIATEISTPTPLLSQEFDDNPPAGAEREFITDFSKHNVSYDEIFSGGPPKDGIPSIDFPKFISVDEASSWLVDNEPVIFVQVGENVRAYPV